MSYYKDLREYVRALDDQGKLVRINKPINKDTQLHPLVRLQFRGLPEEERKAFYFDNVFDSKGQKYDMPVLVGALGASPQVYAIGMMCEVDAISREEISTLSSDSIHAALCGVSSGKGAMEKSPQVSGEQVLTMRQSR